MLLIISRLPVLHHKHPHELLDSVVKERSVKSFVSTEAAHSTAASFLVKLFLKNFSFLLNRLRFRSAPGFSSAGGEFYSVSNRCQPPTSSRFRSLKTETSFESTNLRINQPSKPGAFYSNPPPVQPLFSSKLLFYKGFSEAVTLEVVRIIGPQSAPSTANCRFILQLARFAQRPSCQPGKRAPHPAGT